MTDISKEIDDIVLKELKELERVESGRITTPHSNRGSSENNRKSTDPETPPKAKRENPKLLVTTASTPTLGKGPLNSSHSARQSPIAKLKRIHKKTDKSEKSEKFEEKFEEKLTEKVEKDNLEVQSGEQTSNSLTPSESSPINTVNKNNNNDTNETKKVSISKSKSLDRIAKKTPEKVNTNCFSHFNNILNKLEK